MKRIKTAIPFTFALVLLMTARDASAEYRVYQYYVRTKVANINPAPATLVTSTLDPISYAAYNGGSNSIEINLLRSWICLGNTSKRPPCTISEGRELSEGFSE